ncbi:MAG: methionyl-tRNA formyltransferase [Chloroflexi bacterium]|nr:methionyl-tRNA formyltransferase [Chloroflexota bacterium]
MGTPAFAVPALEALADQERVLAVVTQPDRPAGRGRSVKPSPVKEAALARGLEVLAAARLRDNEEVLAQLSALLPDVVVAAAFGAILPLPLLALPRWGCLNIHASLLPRHRGAAPVAAAILAGDRETGVTVMRMDEGLDTGDIVSQASLPIADDQTTGGLTDKLALLGRDLLMATLPRWVRGEIRPRPQDAEQATFAPVLRKADGEMDWRKGAVQLGREVRAFSPWPGSYTFWRGQRLRVLAARPAEVGGPPEGQPGQMVPVGRGLGVVTGDGVLLLQALQREGKREMTGEAFRNGTREALGACLGR